MNVMTRPRVSDLVLHLYGKALHPELFDILAVRKIHHEDYELTVQITRTGHVITWNHRDAFLTEFAGEDQGISDAHRLFSHRLRGEHTARVPCGRGICYQAGFQVEVLPLEIFLHV